MRDQRVHPQLVGPEKFLATRGRERHRPAYLHKIACCYHISNKRARTAELIRAAPGWLLLLADVLWIMAKDAIGQDAWNAKELGVRSGWMFGLTPLTGTVKHPGHPGAAAVPPTE